MKIFTKSILVIVLLIFIGCSSNSSSEVELFEQDTSGSTSQGSTTTTDGETTTDGGTTTGETTMLPSTVLSGQFVSDAHPTSGTVIVNDDSTVLDFESFMTDDGPKLLVYLSATVNSTDYVDLGDLKGISGNYSYTIPADTDLSKYKYVVIWCVDFSVSFGHAELK